MPDVSHDLGSFIHELIVHLPILGGWGKAKLYYDDGCDFWMLIYPH